MVKPTYILGISCYYHDSAVTLMKDGEIVFAAQEERYTRKKQDDSLPTKAMRHAMRFAGIGIEDITAIAYYEKPLLKFFDRIIPTFMKVWPRGLLQFHRGMQEWMGKKLWIPQNIRKEWKYKGEIFYVPHHESHAASAFFVSGFDEAAVLTVDGVGEWATTTIGHGKGTELTMLEEIHFPHSLGLLYSALTYYLGFRVNSAEYKVMGLAPYGEPKYLEQMRQLIDLKEDGSFRLNMPYFTYEYGSRMSGRSMEKLFDQPRRTPESPLTQFHKDIARSLQEITNEVMLGLARHAKEKTGATKLCLAGGVALNCVANGEILESGLFDDLWIQPAAGDAGGSLGAALAVWHKVYNGTRTKKMEHVFLGNNYTNDEIEAFLKTTGAPYEHIEESELFDRVAELLEGDNAVPGTMSSFEKEKEDVGSRAIGWFQGRMEFGPRSLGNRSILADARNKENWQKVNRKIKFRESFRPFAPTVLEERVSEYFDMTNDSPYMLLVAETKPEKRDEIPAVTHVDGSARIQTIREDQNPRYYRLLKAFEKRTGHVKDSSHVAGCPVIINTSFNVRGEPIVESPANAFQTFIHTDMDYLVLGNFLLTKASIGKRDENKQREYVDSFALD